MAQSTTPPPRQPPSETEAERRARAAAEEQATRTQAEAATAHLPQPGTPPQAPVGATELFAGEPTVLMNFPEEVTYTCEGPEPPRYTMVTFPAGLQPVPQSLANNQWFVDRGVTPVASGRA
jgi:hypothetical protein